MADNYTHQRNANNARAIAGYKPRHPEAFIMGANGPDLFFYYQVQNVFSSHSLHTLGNEMHNKKTGLFLKTMFSMAKTDVQKDYCLGFLCHYATDSLIHPYVEYITTAYASPYNIPGGHSFFESALDSKLSMDESGTPVADNALCAPEISEFNTNQITYLLRNAVAEVYPEFAYITQTDCETAIKDLRFAKKVFISPTKIGHFVAGLLEKMHLFGEGVVTSHMQPCVKEMPDFPVWEDKRTGLYSIENIDDILKRADYLACDLLIKGLNYFRGNIDIDELAREIGSRSYDTGITVE